jgi:XRE family transcriptional regulator, aerobic/anaerobic benzoate catabolism transcriptional regulator
VTDPQPPWQRALAAQVRRLRHERGLTLKELAAESSLSVRLLSLVEAGQANPTLSSLHDLALALGVEMIELLQDARASERHRPVALLGLRGAGKSTIGPKLAAALGWPFIELDRRIEQESGLSLSTLFELHGEPHVRRLEARVLANLLGRATPIVIAAGGGVVNEPETWAQLRAQTTTVWLKATPQEHWDRVRAQGDERPMARRSSARAELDALWQARSRLYNQAALHVDTSGLGIEGVVAFLLDKVRPAANPAPH